MVLFSSTIGNILWVLLVISIAVPMLLDWRKRRAEGQGP